MSPRKFNLICVTALLAVVALAMFVAGTAPEGSLASALPAPQMDASGNATSALGLQPLSLGLSITIVVDMGLMTAGLVILFKDEGPSRYRVR